MEGMLLTGWNATTRQVCPVCGNPGFETVDPAHPETQVCRTCGLVCHTFNGPESESAEGWQRAFPND